ncbi:hypothetical protein GFB56_34295 [Ensifer sp. T173]|uniref:DUF1330 domain-containing protein n=1 Tax=Ensifer canadensis TaxID=555315 RepID=A0AAW4FXB5_9HYPH|nr:hypothetical protein [Ensifer canadensis]MBM3095777.1 hypothetical protein [Ensifer canadensis]UBI79516.1 hypothetical protein J3R84_31645 [Ensifer canadensis]
MHLIQIFLPLVGNKRDSSKRFAEVRDQLTTRFGGATLYRNAPAEGLWEDEGAVEKDFIIIAEVMAVELDQNWWADYRKELERRFKQDEIVVRAVSMTRL